MNRDILRIIAASELLGGILLLAGYALVPLTGYRIDPAWQALPAMAFGAFSMAGGIALYRQYPWGVRASLGVQLLQVASFSVASHFRYVAFAGPLLQLIVSTTGIRINAGGGGAFVAVPWSYDGSLGALGAHLEAGIGFQPGPLSDSTFTMAANLVAIYFLWRLSAFWEEPAAAADSRSSELAA